MLTLALGGLAPAASAQGAGGRIAFERSGDIYTMNPDGSDQTLVASDGFDPSFSLDGRKIAFSSASASQESCSGGHIFTLNANGSGLMNVSAASGASTLGDKQPSLSADGQELAFEHDRFLHGGCWRTVATMNADGGGRQECEGLNHRDPAISPDGATVAFVHGMEGDLIATLDTGAICGDPPPWYGVGRDPAFSPDGQRIAFWGAGSDSGMCAIRVVDVGGANQSGPLADGPCDGGLSPTFSPDGQRIAFSRGGKIYVLSLPGGGVSGPLADGANPSWGGGGPCRVVDVVQVCADSIDADGRATGNVTLNGGVSVGDGPLLVNEAAHRIHSDELLPVRVIRPGGPVSLGSYALDINTQGVTDPVSRQSGVAPLRLSGPHEALIPALAVAALSWDRPETHLDLFLDPRAGGGIIGSAKLRLTAGRLNFVSLDAFAVGIHAGSALPVQPYAADLRVRFPEIGIQGWTLKELELTLSPDFSRWDAKATLGTPAVELDVMGSLVNGRIDSLGVALARDVPVARIGPFRLTKLGGEWAGIQEPPQRISAIIGGNWGELLHLDDAKLTYDTTGTLSLVAPLRAPRPNSKIFTGEASITGRFSPFLLDGRLQAQFQALGITAAGQMRIALTADHFLASSALDVQLWGGSRTSAQTVVSDVGVAATVSRRVCSWFSSERKGCETTFTGVGMRWSEAPLLRSIGADIGPFITIAKTRTRRITVPLRRPELVVTGRAEGGPPEFALVAPDGRRYTTKKRRPDSYVQRDADAKTTLLVVHAPRPGRWRLEAPAGVKTDAQVSRLITPLKAKFQPRTTKKRRLGRRAATVVWSSKGLPKNARVALYVARSRSEIGDAVRNKLKPNGRIRLPVSKLRKGQNYLRLVVTVAGLPIQDHRVREAVWR